METERMTCLRTRGNTKKLISQGTLKVPCFIICNPNPTHHILQLLS